MKIGLTYDLRDDYLGQGLDEEAAAEFDRPETIVGIRTAIESFGHEVDSVGNLHALLPRLIAGDRWDLVFNIAEGLHGPAREAQVPALLDAYRVPYTFSDGVILGLCLHKGLTKHVVRDAGVATPEFVVVGSAPEVERVDLPFPLFAKPVAEGTSKGVTAASRVETRDALRNVCEDLLERFSQPVLVERFLPGREFTVGIVGTGAGARSLGVLEVLAVGEGDTDVYSFLNKEHFLSRCEYRLERGALATRVEEVALAAWRVLGCRDAGRVDVRLDSAGEPQFIEVNPLAGLNPERSDLAILARMQNVPYRDLIGMILDSACSRIASSGTPKAFAIS